MPRPISSRMTSERASAWFRIRRRLDHFDHEGRSTAGEIVRSAHPAEEPGDHPDPGPRGRHETAGLREHGDQRVSGRRKVDLPAMFGRSRPDVGTVGPPFRTARSRLR